jgi:hypothetical protein
LRGGGHAGGKKEEVQPQFGLKFAIIPTVAAAGTSTLYMNKFGSIGK